MAAPQHQAGRGLSHSGNQLRDAQTGLDVPTYGVQQKQDSVDLLILLQAGQQGHDMLVFGAFRRLRQNLVALYLPYDGQGVDIPPFAPADGGAEIHDPLAAGVLMIVFALRGGGFGVFFHCRSLAFAG